MLYCFPGEGSEGSSLIQFVCKCLHCLLLWWESSEALASQSLCHKERIHTQLCLGCCSDYLVGGTRKDLATPRQTCRNNCLHCFYLSFSRIHSWANTLTEDILDTFSGLETCNFLEGKYTVSLISCLLHKNILGISQVLQICSNASGTVM